MSSGSSINYPLEDHGEHRHASSGHGDKHLSDFNHPPPDFDEPGGKPRDAINDKMMVSPIIVIFLVLLFAFLFNVFARWFWLWRQSARLSTRNRRRSASIRRQFRLASIRRQFNFTGEEPARLLNVGLDSAVLKTLPIFLYKSQNFTDGLDCAICLCEFEENEKARLLPNCGHSFHVECIDMWFRSHSTCPLCRTVAQPEQPVLESATTEQVSVRIPGPGFHNNLNLEQEQTVSCGEDYNLQNPTNIFSWGRQKHMKTEMDEGTSNGGALMPHIAIDIPKRSDGFLSGKGIHLHSPNSSQSSSNSPIPRLRSSNYSPIPRLRSFTRMFSTDTEKRLPN